jgi:hypothetical protein
MGRKTAVTNLRSTLWIACQEMCQIVVGREHRDPLSQLPREVSKLFGHQPGTADHSGLVHGEATSQDQEAQALYDEELQPKRRKPEAAELRGFYDGPVFFDDQTKQVVSAFTGRATRRSGKSRPARKIV